MITKAKLKGKAKLCLTVYANVLTVYAIGECQGPGVRYQGLGVSIDLSLIGIGSLELGFSKRLIGHILGFKWICMIVLIDFLDFQGFMQILAQKPLCFEHII